MVSHVKQLVILFSLVLLGFPIAAQGQETLTSSLAEEDAAAARAVVESLHAALLSCMLEADQVGFEGRYDRIVANLQETFDLPFMARISIGRAWKDLSPEQRVDFVDLSRRLSASRYADNFNGYGGETFETLAEAPAARSTIVVKTQLVLPSEDDVRFDYRLRNAGDGWRIIDVQLDGKVSEITLRRSDYRAVIERRGFSTLVEELEKKIEDLSPE
jgi:phospholipid transport system substrate-binding protein